jgi:hypothetical protein
MPMPAGSWNSADLYPNSPQITGPASPAPPSQQASGGSGLATGTAPIMYWAGIIGALVVLRFVWERAEKG